MTTATQMECALCRDIYSKGGSVEGFLAHYNKDHCGQPLPINCRFVVHQCGLCQLVTKTRRGLSRHINAKHGSLASCHVEADDDHSLKRSNKGSAPLSSSQHSFSPRSDAARIPAPGRQDFMSQGGTCTVNLDTVRPSSIYPSADASPRGVQVVDLSAQLSTRLAQDVPAAAVPKLPIRKFEQGAKKSRNSKFPNSSTRRGRPPSRVGTRTSRKWFL